MNSVSLFHASTSKLVKLEERIKGGLGKDFSGSLFGPKQRHLFVLRACGASFLKLSQSFNDVPLLVYLFSLCFSLLA